MDANDAVAAGRIGEVLGGRWKLERVLGTGGMAVVYGARDSSGAVAAIKLLHPEMTLRPDVRERFLREAYVANRVDHPGAVRVIEHGGGADGEPAYIVMELLEGQTLADRVMSGIGTADLLDYMDQILDVLDHAHQNGIIHRDLKPENLFVAHDGRVKILDFGLARMLDDVPGDFKTRTGMALGTLPYMAPEQALGRREELDGRVDLFALGATAFRVASGRKIHLANSEAELLIAMASKPAPPLATIAPAVPLDVCAIIDLALAFSKEARYPDARTMQRDVRDVRAGRRPTYASERVSARDGATRVDMQAPVVPAPAPASRRAPGVTVPLQAVDPPLSTQPVTPEPVPAWAPVQIAVPPPAPPSTQAAGRSASRSVRSIVLIGLVGIVLIGAVIAAGAFVVTPGTSTADTGSASIPTRQEAPAVRPEPQTAAPAATLAATVVRPPAVKPTHVAPSAAASTAAPPGTASPAVPPAPTPTQPPPSPSGTVAAPKPTAPPAPSSAEPTFKPGHHHGKP